MNEVQNRHYFIFFAIFFVACSPFLIFLSFGYDVNLRDQSISNTTTIRVDTFPKNALIKVKNETKGTSPTELYSQDSEPFDLTISSPKYLNESFLIDSSDGKNSSVDLKNLFLLPKDSEINNVKNKNFEPVSFLSKDQVIIRSGEELQIQDFGVGGVLNTPLFISEKEIIGGKFQEKIVLQKETQYFLTNNKKEWQKLSGDTFYNDNFLLQKKTDYWLISDISKQFTNGIKNILKLDSKNFLVLDNLRNLWNWDGVNIRFVDAGFDSIFATASPEYIWILKGNSVYRLRNSDFLSSTFDLNNSLFLTSELIELNKDKFKVAPFFQGIGIQVNQKIFYVPDFAVGSWSILTDNATNFFADNNSMFWLDGDNYINFYNFVTYQRHIFPQINKEYSEIVYSPDWSRVMLYSPDKVFTIWFNKDVAQPNILMYSMQEWIGGTNCFPKVLDKVQYCIRDKELVLYKNNLLF
jgi:hypothetical protein